MNNRSNRNEDAFEGQFLNWLLSKPNASDSSREEENLNPLTDLEDISRVEYLEWDEPDPLDDEDIDFQYSESQSLRLGEIPTVQDRFQTLLKERLKPEILCNPPLFPWETQVEDYAYDYPDVAADELVPSLDLWTAHLPNIRWGRLPIPLTEKVFAQLLESCQDIAQSGLREGAKMVQAVENALFPQQNKTLNDLTLLIFLGELRGTDVAEISRYEEATLEQQMVLSLLAAREIMGSLTLNCPLNQQPIERQWLTAAGLLNLKAAYESVERNRSAIRVECELPTAGSIELRAGEATAITQRSNSGYLSVKLFEVQVNNSYPLTVRFQNQEHKPMKFAVYPTLEVNN
ncbi:hypothetical protein BCD67_13550 [Oscillatoriales cyanobacterium USR001]|nr:hypothetical protein BCD67_13550 [Oscillatoriales cyanobacterium USR001]